MIILLIVVLAALAALLGVAAGRPKTFTVKRRALIAAAPEAIFPLLEDFHCWAGWSPWADLDPEMKTTFGGAARGVGATYAWEGDKTVGAGRMEITEARGPEKLALDLTMLRPFPASNRVEFHLVQLDDGVQTAWVMTGAQPFMMRLMGLFMNMDRMVGRDFEKGLARLKALAER